jgi:hypothetical protein
MKAIYTLSGKDFDKSQEAKYQPLEIKHKNGKSKLAKALGIGVLVGLTGFVAKECDSKLIGYDFRNLNSHRIEGYDPFNKADLKKALEMEGWGPSERNIDTYLEIVNSQTDGRAPGFYDLNKDRKILGKNIK